MNHPDRPFAPPPAGSLEAAIVAALRQHRPGLSLPSARREAATIAAAVERWLLERGVSGAA